MSAKKQKVIKKKIITLTKLKGRMNGYGAALRDLSNLLLENNKETDKIKVGLLLEYIDFLIEKRKIISKEISEKITNYRK